MTKIQPSFNKTHIPFGVPALAAVMMIALVACSSGSKPLDAKITAPVANAEVNVGDSVTIQGQVTGDSIVRVDVIVDSATHASLYSSDKTKGVSSFPVQVTWSAQLAGSHFVQLTVYGADDKLLGKSDPVIFIAKAALAQPATSAAPTAAPTAPPATPTTALAATAAATAAPTAAITPMLTISNTFANIRSGPGTEYDMLGTMQQGESAPVRGKNADGTWWQIAFAKGTGGVGWVRGDLVQPNGAANAVPVAQAPAPPTVAPVTNTNTPVSVIASTTAPTTTAVPVDASCNSSMPEWRGTNPNYPFCAKQDLTWGDPTGDWNVYDNGKSIPLSILWNVYGSNISQVWLHFEQDNNVCGFARPAQKTINQQVPLAGPFNFNIIDFPFGGTYRVYLSIQLTDGRVVGWGDKKLCIR